jgi:hypothetical protein
MSEIFQIRCPACNSKLNAKASLIGQTRNCPKCQTPILIQQHFDLDKPAAAPPDAITANSASLRAPQLVFQHRYFILGPDQLIAVWEGSQGWRVNAGSGFVPARTNMGMIPDQGVFAFVEMTMDAGIPLKLLISKISSRGALTVLFRDDHAILEKLEEPVDLTVEQKNILLYHLRQMFMSNVLDDAREVINYLVSL